MSNLNIGQNINKNSQLAWGNINIGDNAGVGTSRQTSSVVVGENACRYLYSIERSVVIGNNAKGSEEYINNSDSNIFASTLVNTSPSVKDMSNAHWFGTSSHNDQPLTGDFGIFSATTLAGVSSNGFRLKYGAGAPITVNNIAFASTAPAVFASANPQNIFIGSVADANLGFPGHLLPNNSYHLSSQACYLTGAQLGFAVRGSQYAFAMRGSSINSGLSFFRYGGGSFLSGLRVLDGDGFSIEASEVSLKGSGSSLNLLPSSLVYFASSPIFDLAGSGTRNLSFACDSGSGTTVLATSNVTGASNNLTLPSTTGTIALVDPSSKEVKENIRALNYSIVDKLKPVKYTYKEGLNYPQGTLTGFLIEDIQEDLKDTGEQFIAYTNGSASGIHYHRFVPHLVKEIQDLKSEVDCLKELVNLLLKEKSE